MVEDTLKWIFFKVAAQKRKWSVFKKEKNEIKRNIKLISVQTSDIIEKQHFLQEFMMGKLDENKHLLWIGKDSNAQLDIIKDLVDESELKDDSIGKFGLERRDNMGEQSLEFLTNCDLVTLNTTCQNNMHVTHKKINKNGMTRQIDQMSGHRELKIGNLVWHRKWCKYC